MALAPTFARVPIRVLLAERNVLVRHGVSRLIDATTDLELVGTCADPTELDRMTATTAPDVVVTECAMPTTALDARVGLVVLAGELDPSHASEVLAEGCEGRAYLVQERLVDVAEVVDAIRRVAAGGSVIDPKVLDSLITGPEPRGADDLDRLTQREAEVLGEMATGKSNAAIASALVLSERAVEKHTNAIFAKLGLTARRDVNRRVTAVVTYLRRSERHRQSSSPKMFSKRASAR